MAFFSFGKSGQQEHRQGSIPDFAPGDIGHNAKQKYFELGSQSRIERNRWFLVAVIEGVALAGLCIGTSFLFPLKTVDVIQVSKLDGGRLVADPTPVGRWEPDNDSLAFFINKWAEAVFDVKHATIQQTVAESSKIAIDSAAKQLQDFRFSDNPIAKLNENPGYSRTYEFKSINFMNKETALLRFKTITRNGDNATEDTYLMTVTFTLVKPSSVEQVVKNPAGLYITNFSLSKEATTQTKVTETKAGDVLKDRKAPSTAH